MPLRHKGMSTFDELQMRHQHGFLYCLTISLSLHNTGTTTLSKNCTWTKKNTVSTCLCCTTGMSTILSRNTKNSKSCWNLSLKITGTSTTLSRPSSTRKFFLLPLFLSPRLTGEEAAPLAPCIGLGRIELFVSHHPAVKLSHARLVLRFLPLPPPLLLLLQLEVLGQEEGDGGAVNAVGATQRRHHQERSFSRGVPHGAVTPLRPGNLRQRCRALPRRWSLLSPVGGAPYAVCTLPDEWCITVARAAAIDCCSCRHHERSRRCLRR